MAWNSNSTDPSRQSSSASARSTFSRRIDLRPLNDLYFGYPMLPLHRIGAGNTSTHSHLTTRSAGRRFGTGVSGLTTEFLGVATETTPPLNPRFSVVWQATWEDGTEIVRETFTVPRSPNPQYFDNNMRRIQLQVALSQRPVGGTITQTLSITDQTPGFNRLQAYRTSLEFSGKIIYGEHEVSGDIPESSQRQAFHSGFDEGFE